VKTTVATVGNNRLEILSEGEQFVGIGKVWIGQTLVRSGRLPMRPFTQSFAGWGLSALRLVAVDQGGENGARISLQAIFTPLDIKLLRDHSFDPIHDTGDWQAPDTRLAHLHLVIEPAADTFGGRTFEGFAYHWEYESDDVPIFYLYDRASWELDGDITGATIFNQSACSDPVVTIGPETAFNTEGILHFLVEAGNCNPIMTHNLPRWADHQAWDFQFKADGRTLVGVFERVDLIRSLLKREPGKAELKTFDKYIFDEALKQSTPRKKILLNTEAKSLTDQKNLWTWMFDDLHGRARAEYGLKEQPPVPMFGHHYWSNFTIDTYYKDIVPACAAVGIRAIFAENFKKSDESEKGKRLPNGNMCCSHEYEIAQSLGGTAKFKEYVDRCHQLGIKNYVWTNTYVSLAAEMNAQQRDERGWYMAMEDTRIKYAGAYTMVSSNLDIKNADARKYWVDAHKKIKDETGVDGFYIDSHYNLFFMPVNFKTGHPRTSWRESLEVMKELQDHGVEWYIESFGPFGQPGHGHHATYTIDKAFICYYVGLGDGSATVPVPGISTDKNVKHDAAFIYYQLAHKVPCALPLMIEKKRIDEVYGAEHRRILREYHDLLPLMHKRYLQEDGLGVIWHDREGKRALLWNIVARKVKLPGRVRDVATASEFPQAEVYELLPCHTYEIHSSPLPIKVE